MFSNEYQGYNKKEVDSFIQRLKTDYESKLMQEKLNVLQSEKKLLDLKNERYEIENKEKNIMNALSMIEKVNQYKEEGVKNYYRLTMEKVGLLVRELNIKFPEMKKDTALLTILGDVSEMVFKFKNDMEKPTDITQPISSENDSMRILLNKMQDYKKTNDLPKEVFINTNKPDIHAVETHPLKKEHNEEISNFDDLQNFEMQDFEYEKPTSPLKNDRRSEFANRVLPDEKAEKPVYQKANPLKSIPVSESGFSFEEALNPKDDLSEIMKAFDFYNEEI